MKEFEEILRLAREQVQGWERIKQMQIEEYGRYGKGIDASIEIAAELIKIYQAKIEKITGEKQ